MGTESSSEWLFGYPLNINIQKEQGISLLEI